MRRRPKKGKKALLRTLKKVLDKKRSRRACRQLRRKRLQRSYRLAVMAMIVTVVTILVAGTTDCSDTLVYLSLHARDLLLTF